MIPGPRPSKVHERAPAGDDDGAASVRGDALPPVTLTRTGRGWSVLSTAGTAPAGNLVEGLSLADLIAEEAGTLVEPDRTARRSARGSGQSGEPTDPADARVAALERTVAQLEHALAARVSTERAIGVLAERHRTSPRVAFESLRREARSSGRPVAELAREVLAGLEQRETDVAVARSPVPGSPGEPPAPRALHVVVAAADGRP